MSKGGKRVRKQIVGQLLDMSEAERQVLFSELKAEEERQQAQAKVPWPKRIKIHIHENEENLYEEAKALGLPDDERWNPVYEVTVVVEVTENFTSKIIACDGYMLDFNKPFEGETVDYS